MLPSEALQQAIDFFGGQTAMAEHYKVTQPAISQWLSDGVPINRCEPIEADTGVRVEDLRPDLQWQRNAESRVIGYLPPPVAITPTRAPPKRRKA